MTLQRQAVSIGGDSVLGAVWMFYLGAFLFSILGADSHVLPTPTFLENLWAKK